jgi:hypothetical protein
LSENDDWWKSYLSKNTATKFADFGSASYARVYYDQLGTQDSSRIVFAVEDQTEMRILLEVKKLIDSETLPKPNENGSIIGLYPFTPVIFPDSGGAANATFFTDGLGKKSSVDSIFKLCERFAERGLVNKAKATYSAILSSGQTNNIQFNMT